MKIKEIDMKTKFFVTIIILLLLVILIYDHYIKEDDVCETKTCEAKYPYTSLEFNDRIPNTISFTGDAKISIKSEGVYLTLYESQSLEESVQTIYTNLMANGDIKLNLDNVVFAYPLTMGMTTYADYFAFLHNDGTISVLSMGEIKTSGIIEVKKIEGLTNIINIYNTVTPEEPVGVDYAAIAVDVNGEKHEINMPMIDQW